MPSSRDTGPLRFRGSPEEQADQRFINVEQQPVVVNRKGKGLRRKLFRSPDSFFSTDWTPAFWISVSVGYLILIALLVNFIHKTLPAPVLLDTSSTVHDDSERFIAARAQVDLNILLEMGPRPVGSKENEELAPNFIRSEILKIKEKSSLVHDISIDSQVVSGSYYIDQKPVGYATFYDHVQNIVVRLSSGKKAKSSAVLVNCHYDSVPGSPGASDDAYHCAVMLELLRVLSRMHKPFLHDIIFLFNGAEESGLQASHGFITKHKWAQDVRLFINLEGCGAGGKEILFQTGPNCPFLVETYATAVPHPHGNVMAEELFQSGVIPSDTDFRIFRDFGHVPGVDFANVDNGFVYHTKFDNGKLVSLGSYQHTGDNMLALVQALANSPLLDSTDLSGEPQVYFDILGLWFIQYSQKSGTVLNTVTVCMSMCVIAGLLIKIKQVVGLVLGWVSSALYVYFLSVSLNWVKCTQSWYRSYFYQFGLYYCPTMLFCILGPLIVFNRRAKLSSMQLAQINSLGTQFLWTCLLLLGTLKGIRSSYIIFILILSTIFVNMVQVFWRNRSVKFWIGVQVIQATIPVVIGIYHTIMAMAVFIPITNRSGSTINVELYIGTLSAATCIMTISFLVPLIMFIRHVSVVVPLAAVHLVGLILVLLVQPLPFYVWSSGESGVLQRVPLWHVERTLYDKFGNTRLSDSGYWMINMDPSSPYLLKSFVKELNSAENATNLCGSELFCALPFYSPRMSNFVRRSNWIPGPKPFEHPIFQMNFEREFLSASSSKRRINFSIIGPQQMSFMFSPLPGVSVSGWSLEAKLVQSTIFNDRPAFFVFYQRGQDGQSWTFSIDFELDEGVVEKNSNQTVTVGLAGSYIHPDKFSLDFKRFMNNFPNWAFVSPRSSELKIWEL